MMYSLSLIPAFAAVVLGQGNPLPQTTTPDQPALTGCGGCFIIADVAQYIFADYTTTQTATAVASQGVGRNGSIIQTTFVQPLGQFSYNAGGVLSGAPVTGAYVPVTGTVLTVNGATLTSPTAYNVFTGYTEYIVTQVGGVCSTQAQPPVVVSPYSKFPYGANAGPSAIFEAEQSFIDSVPKLTCAVGGAVVSTTVPVPAVITTVTSSTTSIFRPTPIAASQTGGSAAGTAAGSGSGGVSGSAAATTDSGILISMGPGPSGSSAPNATIAKGAASGYRAPFTTSFSSSLVIALLALPGLGALLL